MKEVHIIGDSNFGPIAEALKAPKGKKPWKEFVYTRSTSNVATVAAIADITVEDPTVFMGVSLNEMGKTITQNPDDWKTILALDLDAYKQLKEAKPNGRIILMSPFPRPGSPIHQHLGEIVTRIKEHTGENDVLKCNISEKELLIDKVHLNPQAINKAAKFMLAEIRNASGLDQEMDTSSQTPARNTRKKKAPPPENSDSEEEEPTLPKRPKPSSTEEMIEALYNNMSKQNAREKEVNLEFKALSLVTAEMKESIDDTENQKTRNVIIVKNLTKLDSFARDRQNKAKEFAEQMCDNLKFPKKAIEYANIFPIGNDQSKKFAIRIALKTSENAEQFKKLYTEASKANKYELKGSNISHQVTNATRIRAQVLWQLAEALKATGEDAWTNPHLSTPILLIRSKEGRRKIKSYKYSEALKKFTDAIKKANLENPRKMADRMFPDVKKQLFLIL